MVKQVEAQDCPTCSRHGREAFQKRLPTAGNVVEATKIFREVGTCRLHLSCSENGLASGMAFFKELESVSAMMKSQRYLTKLRSQGEFR